jgi:16S rRNA pseudouridine516 synthase
MTLLPDEFREREVQAIGRLDHDTTGLLLLTDDGAFNHRMSSPKHHVPKRYLATTAEPVSASLIDALRTGVQLHDEPEPLFAIECVQVSEHQLEIVLAQGKYHQVKRMLAAAGNHCAALQRISIGQLTLASLALAEGEWCYLEQSQLSLLQ